MSNPNELKLGTQAITVTSAVVLKAVAAVVAKGSAIGHNHSFEYWLEECITMGANAQLRSWQYSEDTKNAKAFTKAVSELNPTSKDFMEQLQSLQRKYGVGGTQVPLS